MILMNKRDDDGNDTREETLSIHFVITTIITKFYCSYTVVVLIIIIIVAIRSTFSLDTLVLGARHHAFFATSVVIRSHRHVLLFRATPFDFTKE